MGLTYGRSLRGHKTSHDQTYKTKSDVGPAGGIVGKYDYTNYYFINTEQRSSTNHLILDFQAGKDVGLGMFGGKSTLKAGIRWAKLNEGASGHMSGFTKPPYHVYKTFVIADFLAKHSFDGIGPSVSWDSSVPFAGNQSDELSLDWGIDAALLFGKQKTRMTLHTSHYNYVFYSYNNQGRHQLTHSTRSPTRNKSVIVPNLGGFAGISWRLPNAKISMGYKADFFFNAIDTGIYTRKTENRGFYGPFVSISIGIGD